MKLKKFKNLKFSFMAIVAFMAIMLIAGCGGKTTVGEKSGGTGGSGGAEEVDYYDIVGEVLNDSGDPIEHVFIDIIDFVMSDGGEEPFVASVRTDGNGEFGLRIPGDNAVRQVTLRFAFQDVVTYVQDVAVTANQEVDLETITLTVMSQKTIEDSTIENTLTDNVRANAYVTIGADALEYSDGMPFTTVVPEDEDPITATVAIGYVDTTSNPEFFPDNFYSMDGGSLKLFSTYGILEIKVTTDNGNTKLNLAAGQTATISIPVGDLVNVNDPDFPATVDLWYYDEDAAEWVLEQEDGLTYDADTRSFTGVVDHFSAFNAGYTFESKYVQATVMDDRGEVEVLDGDGNPVLAVDENGDPIPVIDPETEEQEVDDEGNLVWEIEMEPYLVPLRGSTVDIFTDTFSPYGVWNATYTAGSDGKIPDSMDTSITGLLYNDEDGDFLPVPGMGDLWVVLEYTNPITDDPGSVGPEPLVFEEGAITASRDWLLALSTSAYIVGSVEYESAEEEEFPPYFGIFPYDEEATDDPTIGGVWTVKWVAIADDGTLDDFYMGVALETYMLNVEPESKFVVAFNDFFDYASMTALFSPVKDVYLAGSADPVEKDPVYGYPIITTGKLGDTIQIRVVFNDPPSDVIYTHLMGTIDLQDLPDDVDPDNLWVVIEGVYNERPITVRAAVDADGNWPADDGTFNGVTVDGVEGLFVKVPAETDLTITVGDYVTDPLNPVIYQTYNYTSLADQENISEDPDNPIFVPITADIVLAQSTYVSGTVIWKGIGTKNLKVVLENLTDTSEDDITIITQAGGVIPQTALPFSTNYRVTIWTTYPDTTDSLELIYTHPTLLTTAATGGTESILEIDFGVPEPEEGDLIPVIPAGSSAIVGTVLDAEGNPATGDIWISPEGVFGADSIAATVGDLGELSQLEYYGGPVLHEGFVVLDPTMAYYEIREGWANILVEEVATPGPGVVEYLSLVIGEAPMTESYIKGLVLDAEGNPATGDIWISPEGVFGPDSIAATVGDLGELSQLEYYGGPVLHEGFVVLDPTMAYYEIREGWANILVEEVATPGPGVVEYLSLVIGEAPMTESYIKGLVLDAEGNPATGDIWISPEGVFGPDSIAATVGDLGELSQLEYYGGPVLHEGFVVLDPTVAYYEIREGWANILVDEVVTPGAGVIKTLSISFPAP
jgi:hypothetical protein